LGVATATKATTEAAWAPAVDGAATLNIDDDFAAFDTKILSLLVGGC
jgi:hypothetical protein